MLREYSKALPDFVIDEDSDIVKGIMTEFEQYVFNISVIVHTGLL